MLCGPAVRRCWKHSRQYTGRPCVGLNGTVVSFAHCEQTVFVSTRCAVPLADVPPAARFALHALHRLGSFLKPLSAKNICSPAVNTNSAEHSAHFKTLSWYSIRCSKALHWSMAAEPVCAGRTRKRLTNGLFLARPTRTGLSGPRQIGQLVLLTPLLFSETLTREGLFRTTPFTRFHVIAVLFDLLDNVFRLYFSLKTPERIFQRFTLLNDNFCHAYSPPIPPLIV